MGDVFANPQDVELRHRIQIIEILVRHSRIVQTKRCYTSQLAQLFESIGGDRAPIQFEHTETLQLGKLRYTRSRHLGAI